MKGIILAGGSGTRLWPITISISKQLIPVYDKPMIYYPLATLMSAGIREILIITTPHDQESFRHLLGDGSKLGMRFEYAQQPKPEGLAQAFIIADEFLSGESSALILGDNLFYGPGLGHQLSSNLNIHGGKIFAFGVNNPSEYGVVTLNSEGRPISIIEKPTKTFSNLAVTGLYFFDSNAPQFAREVKPSARGELEITSLIERYIETDKLEVEVLPRGVAWLDTGNPEQMQEASQFVRILENRTGQKIAAIEEIAFRNGWISHQELISQANLLSKSEYGKYLLSLHL